MYLVSRTPIQEHYFSKDGHFILKRGQWYTALVVFGRIIAYRHRLLDDTSNGASMRGELSHYQYTNILQCLPIPSELILIIARYVPEPLITNAQEISIREHWPQIRHSHAKILNRRMYVYRIRVAGKWHRCIHRFIYSDDDAQFASCAMHWHTARGDSFNPIESYLIENYVRSQYPEWF